MQHEGHADHFAAGVEHGAATVAGVDGGIGLDHFGQLELGVEQIDIPSQCGDDACGHGVAVAKGIADDDHTFAYPQFVDVPELPQGAGPDLRDRL